MGLVPTASQKQGTFTTIIRDPAAGNTPFLNNQIPASRFDPISAKLLSLFPDPNNQDATRNFIYNDVPSGRQKRNNAVGRVDYNIGDKDNLFGALSV